MRGRSILFRAWQVLILAIRSVTALAFAWLGLLVLGFVSCGTRAGGAATVCAIAEVCFHAYYLRVRAGLRAVRAVPHKCTTREERKVLAERCIAALRAPSVERNGSDTRSRNGPPSEALRGAIEGWFLGTPLEDVSRAAFSEWAAWAFFSSHLEALSPSESSELDEMVSWFEEEIGWSFFDGQPAGDLKAIRLTLDELVDTPRPLFYYVVIALLNVAGHAVVWRLGFRACAGDGRGPKLYCRRGTERAHASLLNGSASSALPVVFVPGIGIGFAQYVALLARLPRGVDAYLVEWPHVAMRVRCDVPSIDDTVRSVTQQLAQDGHAQSGACLVGHSLGSTAVAWLVHADARNAALASKRAPHAPAPRPLARSVVLLDPVTFLLCDSGVASNFLHRQPKRVIELLMHYFVSRELFIAHTLSRHFSWSHNTLFVDDLPCFAHDDDDDDDDGARQASTRRAVIVLSANDAIVPANAVRQYLQRHADPSKVELLWLEHFQHGEMLMRAGSLTQIARRISIACGLEPDTPRDS